MGISSRIDPRAIRLMNSRSFDHAIRLRALDPRRARRQADVAR